LLAQVGAYAARRFGQRIAALGIAPPHAGILRIIASAPKCSQRQLAQQLGILPSRMVILIDELSDKGLVKRHRSIGDRRNYELTLTKRGGDTFEHLSRLAAEHEADLLAMLDSDERAALAKLCQKVADGHGLTAGVHPGYKDL
jgi:DNA-binding MarR family transcriptional regulator